MEKIGLGITLSILLMACGSNAENSVTENIETSKQDKQIVVKEVVKNSIIEEVISENSEVSVPVTEEKLVEVVMDEKKLPPKEISKAVNEEEVEEIVELEEKSEVAVIVTADHNVWNSLTQKNVTATGKVNYKGMKAELSKITTYLAHLKNTPPKANWSKNERLAYWINLYNASTVYLIASNYPVSSITKINGGKPWDKKFVKSGDKVYTLNQIENDIVRPRFKDPRIHAALNCAAISCPKILNGAFLPSKLNTQLNSRTKSWINSVSSNKLTGNTIQVSKIFEWYADDFKASGGTVGFINKYATTKVASGVKVGFLEYDWSLNE